MADYARELSTKFGVGAQVNDTMRMYQMLLNSPYFQQSLNMNAQSGAQLSSNLNQSLAQRGLNTSGIGTISSAMGKSAASFGDAALRGGLFGQAGNAASQNLLARLQAFSDMKVSQAQRPSFLESLTGGVLGGAAQVLAGPAGYKIFGVNQQQGG